MTTFSPTLLALADKHLPNTRTADKLALIADVMRVQAEAWDKGRRVPTTRRATLEASDE